MKSQAEEKKLPAQVRQVVIAAERLLHNQILGIYLYGSATLGNLRPESDIDILIITNQELSAHIREKLTEQLLSVSGRVGCKEKRPLEVTIINQREIAPWQFPPRCEYMYGEWIRDDIEAGEIPQPFYDPDVAILLWQARAHSITITGMEAENLIPVIPFSVIRLAMKESLPGLIASLAGDERNVLLTLARMWFTLETGEICTKDAAAEWVCPKLPQDFRILIEMAKDAYVGKIEDQWEMLEYEAALLADFMRLQIEVRV